MFLGDKRSQIKDKDSFVGSKDAIQKNRYFNSLFFIIIFIANNNFNSW